MTMTVSLLIAGTMLFLGILIRFCKCYVLIAGYNTMSKAEQQVDINGLGRLIGNYLLGMGGLFLLSGLLGWERQPGVFTVMLLVFAGVTVWLLFRAQKFNPNPQENRKTGFIIILIMTTFIGAGGLIYYGSRPPEVEVNSKLLEIKGMYGLKVPQAEIAGITLIKRLPQVRGKTNGFNYGNLLKGNFRLQGIGAAKLFVYRDIPPYILITAKRTKLFVNFKEPQKTSELYRKLLASWKPNELSL
jgi:hypothetical protein